MAERRGDRSGERSSGIADNTREDIQGQGQGSGGIRGQLAEGLPGDCVAATTGALVPPLDADARWYVYVLRCADGCLYTGVARDVERRLRQHNGEIAGGARYTRGRRPVTLIWSEVHDDRAAAQRREAALKRLPRPAKLALIGRAPRELPAG